MPERTTRRPQKWGLLACLTRFVKKPLMRYMNRLARLGVSVLSCFGAGLLGSVFVSSEAANWYAMLAKPSFTPPDWIFGPVWTVLYLCMALALWLVWEKDADATDLRGWVPLFFAHLLVNIFWTIFFFHFHTLLIAFIDILILIICVILLICGAWQHDRRAAYLLMPYLAWICFAALLNGAFWYLN